MRGRGRWLALVAIVIALALIFGGRGATRETAPRAPSQPETIPRVTERAAERAAPRDARSSVGFRSPARLDEHFAKHGAEFGRISEQEYLLQAQSLRDAPAGGSIQEVRRADGVVSRYDRGSGAFIAFDRGGTIRTFFKPNDGEAYFRRQSRRAH